MQARYDGSPQPKRRWLPTWLKVVLIVLAVIFGIPATLQVTHVLATAPMVAIADRMHPAPGWNAEGENVTGGPCCIRYDVDCDSMWRSYRTEQKVAPADVQRISDEAMNGAKAKGDSEASPLPSNVTGTYEACSVSAVVDGYDVKVRVLKFSEDSPDGTIQFNLSSVKNRR
jgi:hypothetical protein